MKMTKNSGSGRRGLRGSADWEALNCAANYGDVQAQFGQPLTVATSGAPTYFSIFNCGAPTGNISSQLTPSFVPGVYRIDRLVCHFDFLLLSVEPGTVLLSCGIYLSQFDNGLPGWSNQNPGSLADMARENWIDLQWKAVSWPATLAQTAQVSLRLSMSLGGPKIVQEGYSLRISLAQVPGIGTLVPATFIPWVRYRIQRVA